MLRTNAIIVLAFTAGVLCLACVESCSRKPEEAAFLSRPL